VEDIAAATVKTVTPQVGVSNLAVSTQLLPGLRKSGVIIIIIVYWVLAHNIKQTST